MSPNLKSVRTQFKELVQDRLKNHRKRKTHSLNVNKNATSKVLNRMIRKFRTERGQIQNRRHLEALVPDNCNLKVSQFCQTYNKTVF